MKITIERGTALKNAIDNLSKFLNENYLDYPILNNDMNIYITLKDSDNKLCPNNRKEFKILNNGEFLDIVEEKQKKLYSSLLFQWKSYCDTKFEEILNLKDKIKLDEKYLSTAYEKKRTKANIEKRKIEFEKNTKDLEERSKFFNDYILFFNSSIENDDKNFRIIFTKESKGILAYQYNLYIKFIFTDFSGLEWVFSGFSFFNYKHGFESLSMYKDKFREVIEE